MENEKKVKLIYHVVLAQAKSGKSVSQFCLDKGIPQKILIKWRQAFLKDSKYRNDEWIRIAGHIEKQTKSVYHDDILMKAMKWLEIDLDNL